MQHRPSIRAQHTRLTAWGDLFKIHKSQHDSIRLYLTMRLVGDARPNAKTRRRTGPRDCHTPSRMGKGLVLPRHSAVRPSLRGGEAVAEAATTRPQHAQPRRAPAPPRSDAGSDVLATSPCSISRNALKRHGYGACSSRRCKLSTRRPPPARESRHLPMERAIIFGILYKIEGSVSCL